MYIKLDPFQREILAMCLFVGGTSNSIKTEKHLLHSHYVYLFFSHYQHCLSTGFWYF